MFRVSHSSLVSILEYVNDKYKSPEYSPQTQQIAETVIQEIFKQLDLLYPDQLHKDLIAVIGKANFLRLWSFFQITEKTISVEYRKPTYATAIEFVYQETGLTGQCDFIKVSGVHLPYEITFAYLPFDDVLYWQRVKRG